MKRTSALLLILVVFLACDSQEKRALKEPLLPAETFHWSIIPIAFQPPPVTWERQKHNQGGLLGIWFTHKGSVGERIYIAELLKIGRRSVESDHRWDYSLDDVVEETRFTTAGWPVHPDSFVIAPMVADTVAGLPAYRLEFTLNLPEKTLVGREYYVLKKNRLFEAAFLGLPVNLPLFERVVETISFPPLEVP